MSHRFYESEIEQIALDLLRDENGYTVLFGPDLAEGVNPGAFIAKSFCKPACVPPLTGSTHTSLPRCAKMPSKKPGAPLR